MLKVAERGGRSDFLSYGSDNKFYKLFGIRPFPEGEERQAMNAAFDRFIKAIRTREGEGGRVVLFSKFSATVQENPRGISRDEAQRAIDEFRAGLSGAAGLDFQISDTLEDAFGPNHGIQGKVKGYLLPRSGTVVLIRSALDSVHDGIQTLRHEVLAHYGLNLFEADVKADTLRRIILSRNILAVAGVFHAEEVAYPELRSDEFRIAKVWLIGSRCATAV